VIIPLTRVAVQGARVIVILLQDADALMDRAAASLYYRRAVSVIRRHCQPHSRHPQSGAWLYHTSELEKLQSLPRRINHTLSSTCITA